MKGTFYYMMFYSSVTTLFYLHFFFFEPMFTFLRYLLFESLVKTTY